MCVRYSLYWRWLLPFALVLLLGWCTPAIGLEISQEDMTELWNIYNRLSALNNQLSIELETLRQTAEKSGQQLQTLQAELMALQKELAVLQDELSILKAQLMSLQLQTDNLISELTTLKELLRNSEESLTALEKSFTEYKKDQALEVARIRWQRNAWAVVAGVLALLYVLK